MRAPPSPATGRPTSPAKEGTMEIAAIDLGERAGRDVGDLGELMASIAAYGLRHDITVTPGGRLVLGRRRLEACRALGWANIPATTVTHVQQAFDRMRRDDDGDCTHPLTIPEAMHTDFAVRELQWWPKDGSTVAAGARRRDGRREWMAHHYGLNGAQYGMARALVLAADGEAIDRGHRYIIPASDQARAAELLAAVTRPGDLRAAWHKYEQGDRLPPPAPVRGPRRLPIRPQMDSISSALAALGGITTGLSAALPLGDGIPGDTIERWDRAAAAAARALNRFRKELRQYGYHDDRS